MKVEEVKVAEPTLALFKEFHEQTIDAVKNVLTAHTQEVIALLNERPEEVNQARTPSPELVLTNLQRRQLPLTLL